MSRIDLFAMTATGLEHILANELRQLAMNPVEITAGGVSISGSIEHLQRINLWSRIANRVLVRVAEFHASTFHELERRAKKIEWDRFLAPDTKARFRVTCRKSKLYHSDAVAERLAESAGTSATTEKERQDDDAEEREGQLFVVRIAHDICTISADSSGDLLHRRGYRQAVAKAPLRETIAAAMVIGSGWDRASALVDPMCGAGTIAIEAAMIARRIAPGAKRAFAFENWPGHDPAAWGRMKEDASNQQLPGATGQIIASDRDAGAVAAAAANAERAGVRADIQIEERALSDAEYPPGPGWIVTNPPYGLRVGESAPLRNLYARLGKILTDAQGYRLALLSADHGLESQLGLHLQEVFRTTNGGIPVRLVTGG